MIGWLFVLFNDGRYNEGAAAAMALIGLLLLL